jgi:hypothetical protein
LGTNARAEFTDRDGPPWRSGPTAIDLERQELEAVDHGLLAGAARRAIPRREGRLDVLQGEVEKGLQHARHGARDAITLSHTSPYGLIEIPTDELLTYT